MDRVTASLVARFPFPDAGASLEITPDFGIYNDSAVHLLLHPPIGVISVRATKGDVTVGNLKQIDVNSGAVTFSGGRTASLPRIPVGSFPTFTTEFAVDAEGNDTSVSLHYDGSTNTLSADKDFQGAVSFTAYKSAARRLTYRPLARLIPSGGISVEFGAIVAFRRPKGPVLVYPVAPFDLINGNAVYELYRIVSDTITTPTGEHEKPPAYPTNGNYPDRPPLDISINLRTQRVHEIGLMDQSGRGWANSYFVTPADPYVGDLGYVIPKRSIIASVDQFPRELQLKALDFIASRNLGPQ